MASWTVDLSEYARRKQAEIKEVRRGFVFALYASIVRKTPVDTGRARANWNVSHGSEDTSVTDKTMEHGLKYKQKDIPVPDGDGKAFISNNLPYIATLEYGGYPKKVEKGTKVSKKGEKPARYEVRSQGGFSRQAPNGMVGVTVANSGRLFDAAVRGAMK